MFIHFVGDGDADATAPQMPPDVATAIGLVAHPTTRTLLRSAWATTFDRTTRHERFKPHGFVTLTRCQHKRHQVLVARSPKMHFGAEAALASTQGFRFRSFGRAGRVLMSANDGAIDIMNRPVQLTSGMGLLLDRLKEALPEAGSAPAIEAAGYGLPGAVAFGHVAPGGTGAQQPQDAVDHASVVQIRSTRSRFLRRKQRLEPLPLRVG